MEFSEIISQLIRSVKNYLECLFTKKLTKTDDYFFLPEQNKGLPKLRFDINSEDHAMVLMLILGHW